MKNGIIISCLMKITRDQKNIIAWMMIASSSSSTTRRVKTQIGVELFLHNILIVIWRSISFCLNIINLLFCIVLIRHQSHNELWREKKLKVTQSGKILENIPVGWKGRSLCFLEWVHILFINHSEKRKLSIVTQNCWIDRCLKL